MVFWNRFINKIKTSIDKVSFLQLEEKVKQNKANITTNTNDITNIKSQYAKKDVANTFTAKQTFNNGIDTKDNIKILNDKQLQLGYTDNDIKLKMFCDTGTKHMNIQNDQGDLKLNTTNGNIFINTRDTLNLGTKRINNLGNPNDDQDAATKKYVDDTKNNVVEQINSVNQDLQTQKAIITNMEDRIDEIPNTYLSKVDAQADYARCKNGITNDWYSTNNFRTTPQNFGTISYSKDIATKEYIDNRVASIESTANQYRFYIPKTITVSGRAKFNLIFTNKQYSTTGAHRCYNTNLASVAGAKQIITINYYWKNGNNFGQTARDVQITHFLNSNSYLDLNIWLKTITQESQLDNYFNEVLDNLVLQIVYVDSFIS